MTEASMAHMVDHSEQVVDIPGASGWGMRSCSVSDLTAITSRCKVKGKVTARGRVRRMSSVKVSDVQLLVGLGFGRSMVGDIRPNIKAIQRKLNGLGELFGHVATIELLHPKPLQLNDEHVRWLPHAEHLHVCGTGVRYVGVCVWSYSMWLCKV